MAGFGKKMAAAALNTVKKGVGLPTTPPMMGNMPDIQQILKDPELLQALRDPEVANAFKDIALNPGNIVKYQNNPKIEAVASKLFKMADPELYRACENPEVSKALDDIAVNPANISRYKDDPKMKDIIDKMKNKIGGQNGKSESS